MLASENHLKFNPKLNQPVSVFRMHLPGWLCVSRRSRFVRVSYDPVHTTMPLEECSGSRIQQKPRGSGYFAIAIRDLLASRSSAKSKRMTRLRSDELGFAAPATSTGAATRAA